MQKLPRGCGDPACDRSKIERTDVVCHTHQRFLPFATLPQWIRYPLLIGWAVLICVAFPLTVLLDSPVPILLAAASVAGAVLVFPLRTYGLAALVCTSAWLAIVLALLIREPTGACRSELADMSLVRVIKSCVIEPTAAGVGLGEPLRRYGTVVFIAIAAAWLARFAHAEIRTIRRGYGTDDRHTAVPGLLAFLTAAACAVIGVWVLLNLTTSAIPEWLSLVGREERLILLADWTVGFALFLVAGVSAVDGFRAVGSPFLRVPRQPHSLNKPSEASANPIVQFGAVLARLILVLADTLISVAYWLFFVLIGVINWLIGWTLGCYRLLRDATLIFLRAALTATAMILIPAAGLLTGGWAVARFAGSASHYFADGRIADLGSTAGYAAVAGVALTIAWLALCNLPLSQSGPSASKSAATAIAMIFALVFASGWPFALWGAVAKGPIHIGPVLISATMVVVLVAAGWTIQSRRTPPVAPLPPIPLPPPVPPPLPERAPVQLPDDTDNDRTIVLPLAGVSWTTAKTAKRKHDHGSESVEQ